MFQTAWHLFCFRLPLAPEQPLRIWPAFSTALQASPPWPPRFLVCPKLLFLEFLLLPYQVPRLQPSGFLREQSPVVQVPAVAVAVEQAPVEVLERVVEVSQAAERAARQAAQALLALRLRRALAQGLAESSESPRQASP